MEYYNLGRYAREITSASDVAKTWFNRGLVWMFGFNHEAAVDCFEQALNADPDCGLAHWGMAHALGPNYNKPWEFFDPEERAQTLRRANASMAAAQALSEKLSPVERDLIAALADRFPSDATVEDYAPWNDAFADAMRGVYTKHPHDLDVVSFFVEAMMNRTPWLLWDLAHGKPAEGASTEEARTIIETAFATREDAWDHPGLLHLYIHLMEMSPTPELALRHADRLVDLVPDSGHLKHMATHIDVLCGDYHNVIYRNQLAAMVDKKYEERAGGENFYTIYRIHNLHFIIYGAMFLGQPEPALAAADALKQTLPKPVVRFLPNLFEAFIPMDLHVLVRFGRWQDILDQPFPEDEELFSFTTAMLRYARSVALANLGRIAEAELERDAFSPARDAVQEERFMFNNPCSEVLKIAGDMMLGELAYKSGRFEEGLEHLRQAVQQGDHLLYDEPWGWMQPPRHALGALLLEQGQMAEAEAVYRADLGLDDTLSRPCQHPRNVWSLHGLHECLVRRNERLEARHIKLLLDQAMARSAVPIRASCYCRSLPAAAA